MQRRVEHRIAQAEALAELGAGQLAGEVQRLSDQLHRRRSNDSPASSRVRGAGGHHGAIDGRCCRFSSCSLALAPLRQRRRAAGTVSVASYVRPSAIAASTEVAPGIPGRFEVGGLLRSLPRLAALTQRPQRRVPSVLRDLGRLRARSTTARCAAAGPFGEPQSRQASRPARRAATARSGSRVHAPRSGSRRPCRARRRCDRRRATRGSAAVVGCTRSAPAGPAAAPGAGFERAEVLECRAAIRTQRLRAAGICAASALARPGGRTPRRRTPPRSTSAWPCVTKRLAIVRCGRRAGGLATAGDGARSTARLPDTTAIHSWLLAAAHPVAAPLEIEHEHTRR